jgi:hypothetical protein
LSAQWPYLVANLLYCPPSNTIRGLLKTFGLVVAKGSKGLFPVRVREQIAGNPALIAIQVRSGLAAGGNGIRTLGPPAEIRRRGDHGAYSAAFFGSARIVSRRSAPRL